MKTLKRLIIVLCIIILLTGCISNQSTENTSDNTPKQSANIQSSSKPKSDWNIAFKSKFEESTFYLAGFQDDTNGILLGYIGDAYYSNNGGASWTKTDNKGHLLLGLDMLDAMNGYSCGDVGSIRVTSDGGVTWTRLPDYEAYDQNPYFFISFADRNNGWVASTTKLGATVYGGKSFSTLKLPHTINTIVAINLLTPDNGYVLDSSGLLYATSDSGKTWTKKSLELKDERITGISAAPAAVLRFQDPNNAIAIFFSRDKKLRALRTSDSGDTWVDEPMPDINYGHLYLSRDSKLLTVANHIEKEISVLKYTAE